MQQAGIEQLADQERHAAGGVEVVHVGEAVRIDPREQRHDLGQIGEVVPGELDAGGARHGDQVHRVVGRAAGREQADDAVDDRLLVDDFADGVYSLPSAVISVTRLAAALVSASRSGVLGLTKAAPGRCSPIISISIWLELAVP